MKKNIFLTVFVLCVFSVTLTFSVKTTLSESPGLYFFTNAAGNGSTIRGNLDVSDRSVGGSAAYETGYESNIRGNGGGYDATLYLESGVNTGFTVSSQDINQYSASYSTPEDRVTHVKAKEINTIALVAAIDDDDDNKIGYFNAGLGNGAMLYYGSHNTETWNSQAQVGQTIDSAGYGNFAVGGKAYYLGYVGPEHDGKIVDNGWTQDNISEIDRDYVDFELKQFGGPYHYSIMNGTHVITNPTVE
jgi:hypothetical protein